MATAQMMRTEEKSGTWASMFPAEQVTEQQSALFAKKLLAVAISNITYLRAVFPERAYGDRCLGDLNLKILRDDSSCAGPSQVIKWVKGCFDALDKKYLRMLIIGIFVDPEDPQSVIESYTFKFNYSTQCGVDIYRNGKKITSVHSKEKTKKETIQLLRTIIVLTQTLQPLPDKVMLTMKILYYDEVTPADYEPPGFKAADYDSFRFHDEPVNIKLGDVETPFHGIKMRVKTDRKQFDVKDDAAEDVAQEQTISNSGLDKDQEAESQKVQQTLTQETKKSAGKQDGSTEKTGKGAGEQDGSTEKPVSVAVKEADVPLISPAKPESSTEGVPATPSTPKEDEFKVQCTCGCNEDDGLMIVCDICSFWQHAICYRILNEENAPEEHVCDACAKSDDTKKPSDLYLKELNTFAAQATCLWRRTLVACTEFNRLLPHQLAHRIGVDNNVAQGLIRRLEKESFVTVPSKGKRLGKVVDKEKVLKVGIPAYFKQPPKAMDHTKDAETIPTQEEEMDIMESPKKAASENTKKQQKKDPCFKQPDVNEKISQMTEKAANISLQSHQLRSSSAKRNQGLAALKTRTDNAQDASSDSPKTSENKRGVKRAFSRTNEAEFEVCDSQENRDTRSSRRKKCSDVNKVIRI